MKYTREFIGSTEINISGTKAKIYLYRNENGNIERIIENEQSICPEGTCLEGYNDEMIIYTFEN